ncbi:hypothetical protein J2S43_005104 [Catenuloplanes nepalensis]|uniref:Uncharacterized protein n=1 Tax=Catenuloplanes nepalensis TaxID=587533 RepID=A0ABT9MYT8_9ACTN|nr:hypothetical protein [Catenuloplanes nepalensis]MDP9796592.1 hypothetical protein [Catenuloplanes nepalensis]
MTTVDDLAAEALFVSYLQPSQRPTCEAVQAEVTRMILRLGSEGCAAVMAAEFGDDPETAVRRMLWVRATLAVTYPEITALRKGTAIAR